MTTAFEEMQKLGKDSMDATIQSFGALSKGAQAIAVEIADYNKKVFEQGTAALEKMFGAKTWDKAIEAQTDYFKNAYEGFVSETSKLGELYLDMTKEAFKPFESYLKPAQAK